MIRVLDLRTKEITMSSNEIEITQGEQQSTLPTESMYLASFRLTKGLSDGGLRTHSQRFSRLTACNTL